MEYNLVYKLGLSDNCYLKRNGNLYSHSEIINGNTIRLIECDIEEKVMRVRTESKRSTIWRVKNTKGLYKGEITDVNILGDKWEGDCLDGVPFGFGCLYSMENKLNYEGFVFESMKVCFGCEFYEDGHIIKYQGDYYKNMRFGYGILYSRNKTILQEGEWVSNNPVISTRIVFDEVFVENQIHFGLEEIIINNDCKVNVSSFHLTCYPHLKVLEIGNNCLENVNQFEIENCNELISVIIGNNNCDTNQYEIESDTYFSITNCIQLSKIKIDNNCFNQCNLFCLLESIK